MQKHEREGALDAKTNPLFASGGGGLRMQKQVPLHLKGEGFGCKNKPPRLHLDGGAFGCKTCKLKANAKTK